MTLQLVPHDDPILFERMLEFNFAEPTHDPAQLGLDLIAVMKAKRGYGLSANQCGVRARVFVMDGPTPFVCYNPKIVDLGYEESPPLEEGCLSFPGLVMKIKRPMRVRLRFQTPSGETVTKVFMGMSARCVYHEMLHLEGKPFFTGVGRLRMESALKSAKKRGYDYTGCGMMKHAVNV